MECKTVGSIEATPDAFCHVRRLPLSLSEATVIFRVFRFSTFLIARATGNRLFVHLKHVDELIDRVSAHSHRDYWPTQKIHNTIRMLWTRDHRPGPWSIRAQDAI
jgi:hypothetical protein